MKPILSFSQIGSGSIVRHKGSSEAYVVTDCYGDRATAVRTVDITQLNEWMINQPNDFCPVIHAKCHYYAYQEDSNGDVAIEHCSHPDNPEAPFEGNCRAEICPAIKDRGGS